MRSISRIVLQNRRHRNSLRISLRNRYRLKIPGPHVRHNNMSICTINFRVRSRLRQLPIIDNRRPTSIINDRQTHTIITAILINIRTEAAQMTRINHSLTITVTGYRRRRDIGRSYKTTIRPRIVTGRIRVNCSIIKENQIIIERMEPLTFRHNICRRNNVIAQLRVTIALLHKAFLASHSIFQPHKLTRHHPLINSFLIQATRKIDRNSSLTKSH